MVLATTTTTTFLIFIIVGHHHHFTTYTSDTGNCCRLATRVRQFIGLWLHHHHLLDLHDDLRVVVAAGLLAATTTTTISSQPHHLGHTSNCCRLPRRVRQFIGLWLRHHHLLDLHDDLRVVVAAGLLAATTTTTISSQTHHLGHRQSLPPCKKGTSIYRSLAPPLFHHLFLHRHHYFTTISDTKGNCWEVECSSWSREEENQKESSCHTTLNAKTQKSH